MKARLELGQSLVKARLELRQSLVKARLELGGIPCEGQVRAQGNPL